MIDSVPKDPNTKEWRRDWESQFISLYDVLDAIDSASHQDAAGVLLKVFRFEVDQVTGISGIEWLLHANHDWHRTGISGWQGGIVCLKGVARGGTPAGERPKSKFPLQGSINYGDTLIWGFRRESIAGLLKKNGISWGAQRIDPKPDAIASDPDDAERTAPPGKPRTKRARRDLITAEIEMALEQCGDLTPNVHQIMQFLRKRAGQPDSCIKGVRQDGVLWRDSQSKEQILTLRNLSDRLLRQGNRAKTALLR